MDPCMLSGNTSDRRWNTDWVERLGQDFPEDFWRGRCDIADSAMMSEPTITQIRAIGMDWLGRLPGTFTLCEDLKTQAWAQPVSVGGSGDAGPRTPGQGRHLSGANL